jgi:hypothetical protein
VNDKEADPENETVNLKLMDKPPEKKINKYRMNFICIDLKLNRNPVINAFADLDQVSFMDYLISVISKFTYNQDSYKPELQKYILSIDCMQFGNLFGYPFNISIEKIKEIGLTSYHIVNDYFLKTLCGS